MTTTDRTFRLSVGRFWLWAWLLCALFTLAVYGLIRWSGRELDPNALLACGAGLLVVLSAVGRTYRVTVSPAGLRFMDLQGAWRFLAWEHITWAERTRPFGIPVLDLKVAGLPGGEGVVLLLRDLDGFKAAVAAAAGPHHPVTWALLDRTVAHPG